MSHIIDLWKKTWEKDKIKGVQRAERSTKSRKKHEEIKLSWEIID